MEKLVNKAIESKGQLFRAIEGQIIIWGGEIYGGYVRDLIAGIEPNDIDFKVDKPFDFMLKLVLHGFEVSAKEPSSESTAKYEATFPVTKLVITCKKGFSINADVTVPGTKHEKLDIDVNQLRMRYGSIFSSKNISSIITNIHNRQFVCFDGCDEHRIKKMVDRGWKQIDSKPVDSGVGLY